MRNFGWILLIILIIIVLTVGAFVLPANKTEKAPREQTSIATTAPATPKIAPVLVSTEKTEKAQTTLPATPTPQPKFMPLSITSPAFAMNGAIPARFTCDGNNISPELIFSNIPVGTQSLALTMEDPDVPKTIREDGMWDHWVVWNMPSATTGIKEGAIPHGVVGVGTSKKNSYLGPCPPDREHRYFFTLYALDSILSLSQGATKKELLEALAPHIVEKAQLIGLYNRN